MEGEVREGEGQKNKFRKKHRSVAYTFNMHRTNTHKKFVFGRCLNYTQHLVGNCCTSKEAKACYTQWI